MPYFSFSLKQNFFPYNNLRHLEYLNIKPNNQYFSKNTELFKILNRKDNLNLINYVKYENRIKIKKIGKKVLFCLPPSIGMGDAIEYALAIKSIILKNFFERVSIAFIGRYKFIFEKYFNINDFFEELISKNDINQFDSIFHFSNEIEEFKYQKFIRSDIEDLITKKFNCIKYRNFKKKKIYQIKKFTIFPISKSPIRCLSIELIKKIIKNFSKHVKIEIVLDESSSISNFMEKKINFKNLTVLKPNSIGKLCYIIENIDFGIFPDSGPLHLAKILGKKGLLIETTVSKKILLNNFETIESISTNYVSKFCNSPCGLTNIFNYKNKIGCYDSLFIEKKDILNINLNSLQRGSLKQEYLNYINNPVNCVKNINLDNLINKINSIIRK